MTETAGHTRRTLLLVAAVLFASAGVGGAALTLFSSASAEARRQARLADAPSANRPVDPQAMGRQRPPAHAVAGPARTFPPVASEADIHAMMDGFADELGSRVRATPAVLALGQSASALPQAARLALEPFMLNTQQNMADMLKALGGDPAAAEKGNRAVARLVAMLKGLSLDTSAITIRPAPAPGAARQGEGDGPAERIAMRPGALFPDAVHYEDAKLPAVEVTIPARPAGADPSTRAVDLTVTMVWNAKASAWQPAQYGLSSPDPAAMAAVMAAIRGGKD